MVVNLPFLVYQTLLGSTTVELSMRRSLKFCCGKPGEGILDLEDLKEVSSNRSWHDAAYHDPLLDSSAPLELIFTGFMYSNANSLAVAAALHIRLAVVDNHLLVVAAHSPAEDFAARSPAEVAVHTLAEEADRRVVDHNLAEEVVVHNLAVEADHRAVVHTLVVVDMLRADRILAAAVRSLAETAEVGSSPVDHILELHTGPAEVRHTATLPMGVTFARPLYRKRSPPRPREV